MDLGLSGAAAVVAGATRGIGFATAVALAEEGCRVALIGRDAARLDKVAERVIAAGSPAVLQLQTDLTCEQSTRRAFDEVAESWGQINTLVNVAGPEISAGLEGIDDATWQRAFDEGVLTAIRTVRSALPSLRAAEWGRIVNVTAISVQHQSPNLVSYTAAKAALASVTKNLARSLASDGILVNAVAPGPILTDWARTALAKAGIAGEDATAAYKLMNPAGISVDLGRLGHAEEVAAVIAFCGSRRNGFMTGAHINVDGGSDFI